MSDNEKFADAFNYVLYNGEPIIRPEDLHDSDTNELMLKETGKRDVIAKDKMRDVKRRWILKKDDTAAYLMLGIENQSDVHYAMPPRNMLYDAMEYDRQLKLIRKAHTQKGDLTGPELISGFAKTDRLIPVVTLVVYFGDEEWDGPRTLHDMFDVSDENLLEHVSDYKLNIIVPAEIEDLNKFSTDFKYVMEFLQNTKDDDKLYEIMEEYIKEYGDIEPETVMLLNQVANLGLEINEKEGKVNMCKAWNDRIEKNVQAEREKFEEEKKVMCKAWEDRIEKGIKKGREEGREEIRKNIQNVIANFNNNKLTKEEFMEQLNTVLS